MGFWEVAGLIVGGLVALNSALDAVRGVTLAPVRMFRWLRRAIRAVDVVLSIPERTDRVEMILVEHIRIAAPQVELLGQIATDLGVVVPQIADVHHEVKHNGGSSMKDAVARIEAEQAAVAAQLKITRPGKRGTSPA